MENIICGVIMGIIAFITYTQSKKSKEDNEDNKARILMITAIICNG
jgi:hypothetical protein